MDLSSIGKKVLQEEITSLQRLYQRWDGQTFSSVVQLLSQHQGKVILTGVGKSGYIARKVSSTLNSTGTHAIYLHPSEALHGDCGIYSIGDPTLVFSKSGSTPELLTFVSWIKQFSSPMVAIVGNLSSPLAETADYVLDASITKEADPLGIAPTSSTTVALTIGDAIACALMQARSFTKEDFLRFHPGGQLGKNLGQCVGDCTHAVSQVASVSPHSTLREVVIALTEKPLGAAFVMESGTFVGLICDGDVRRSLQAHSHFETLTAADMMTRQPITISASSKLEEALRLMEDRPRPLNVLPVFNADGSLRGLFRLHDAYRAF